MSGVPGHRLVQRALEGSRGMCADVSVGVAGAVEVVVLRSTAISSSRGGVVVLGGRRRTPVAVADVALLVA